MSDNNTGGKLGEAPAPGSPMEMTQAFLTIGYGLPDGYDVSRIVRHGGRAGTGLTVFISPPGDGGQLQINYERETDCTNPTKLRAQAAADTKGLTRASRINSPKAALAMYEAMCTLADHFEAANHDGQTWEWVQQLIRVADERLGEAASYWALRQLQEAHYSKSLVQNPPCDAGGRPQRPIPVLLKAANGDRFITARHMAVFLRHDLGVEDAGSDDQILTRLQRIGGGRVYVEEWDKSDSTREHKVRLVLYRLPDPDADPDAGDTA